MRVKVIYDPSPITSADGSSLRAEYPAVVKKITRAGWYRIETDAVGKDGRPLYSELFYPYPGGHARGWNTLHWYVL